MKIKNYLVILLVFVLLLVSVSSVQATNETVSSNINTESDNTINDVNQEEISWIINNNIDYNGEINENKVYYEDIISKIHYFSDVDPENGIAIFNFTHDLNITANLTLELLGQTKNFTLVNGNGIVIFENLSLNYGFTYDITLSVNEYYPVHIPPMSYLGGLAIPDSFTNIHSNNLLMYYKNGSQLKIKVTNSKGIPYGQSSLVQIYYTTSNTISSISNMGSSIIYSNVSSVNMLNGYKILIIINGVKYIKQLDKNGNVNMNINLNPGKYEVNIIFEEYTQNQNSENIKIIRPGANLTINLTVLIPPLYGENLIKYYKNDSQYQVKVSDDEGNVLKNTKVNMYINGAFYEKITDSEGIAILNINLFPGDYIITVKNMNSYEISNNIKILSILSGLHVDICYNDRTSYNVKLRDGQGKPLKNKNVLINVNGELFNEITDDRGLCYLNINLEIGEYIATASYANYSISHKIKVNNVAYPINSTEAFSIAKSSIKESGYFPGMPQLYNGCYWVRIFNSQDIHVVGLAIDAFSGHVKKWIGGL